MTVADCATFDALIVGAGLAGSTAAIQLARAGWSVALVERQRFPRRKVCGECLAASNLPLLEVLGVGGAFQALAGPALRRVTLWHGDHSVTADLPRADDKHHVWGRALGRDTLDGLLLEQARIAGASVFQPWSLHALLGSPGAWQCELRSPEPATRLKLRATVAIDAHGCWEDLPIDRPQRRLARSAADLFAFKASFLGSSLPGGTINVLALDGGYGGMVVADGGSTTVACCIRRDRLSALRASARGQSAGIAVEAWLQHECVGVQRALQRAVRSGPWLTSGPLNPGVHLAADDGIFRIGNAAGEAHPILGEGMSMALQSAAMLGSVLLGSAGDAPAPAGVAQPGLQQRYAAAWRRAFVPRLRLAGVFAHLAMSPLGAQALTKVVQFWPGLLTRGARWGGKVRMPDTTGIQGPRAGPDNGPVSGRAGQADRTPPRKEAI